MSEIIEPRLEETFELAMEQLDKAGLRGLPAGVVLCGGTAQLGGIRRLAAEVFRAPVRIGTPTGMYGLTDQISTPAFAASVGLLKWGLDQEFGRHSWRIAAGGHWQRRNQLVAQFSAMTTVSIQDAAHSKNMLAADGWQPSA